MKQITSLLFALFVSLTAFSQSEKVQGNLSTLDTADISILNIFPDSFPNVAVVFKADTRKGEPIWNLTKAQMKVEENAQECDVISLEPISEKESINIGIVIDHSGSMQWDNYQLFDKDGNALFSYDKNLNPILPDGYVSPIDNAKAAVKTFITSFNNQKDYISIVGFSTAVDIILPLTQDLTRINTTVDTLVADSSTALYDAMISGIDQLEDAEGVKVLVVLTDGWDNASESKWNDVVGNANEENIPVYIIGLGYVNVDTLTQIAEETKGKFFLTHSSNSLDTVYAEISKQVKAFYHLVYNSPNLSSADSTRQIELSFDIDSIYLEPNMAGLSIPANVVSFLEEKEKEKQYYLYGGIALAILIAAGTLLFYFQRKKRNNNQPLIKKLFPNPTNGIINLDYESGLGQLQIMNLSGQVIKTIEIKGSETEFDVSDLSNGTYIAVIQAGGQRSNTIKFIVQR